MKIIKQFLLPTILFSLSLNTFAQKDGKTNIDKLCGCFEVGFKYAETFSPDKNYKFHDREVISDVTELAIPIINTTTKVVIQHLLVINDTTIVKHWREDWTYENPEIWIFKGNGIWEKKKISSSEVKGKWTQTVWEVSDAPRYQGVSIWQNVNGHIIWENTTDAPLPRREYSRRSDYNILERTNRLVLLQNGYNHVQDNIKIARTSSGDSIRAEEKGLNSYRYLPLTKCDPANKYWNDYSAFWLRVEAFWEKYTKEHSTIQLVESLGKGKSLNNRLFKLSEQWKSGTIKDDLDKTISDLVSEHLK